MAQTVNGSKLIVASLSTTSSPGAQYKTECIKSRQNNIKLELLNSHMPKHKLQKSAQMVLHVNFWSRIGVTFSTRRKSTKENKWSRTPEVVPNIKVVGKVSSSSANLAATVTREGTVTSCTCPRIFSHYRVGGKTNKLQKWCRGWGENWCQSHRASHDPHPDTTQKHVQNTKYTKNQQ